MNADDKFHNHLDLCAQCAEEIFNLCPVGMRLLHEAGAALGADPKYCGLAQWNQVLRGKP